MEFQRILRNLEKILRSWFQYYQDPWNSAKFWCWEMMLQSALIKPKTSPSERSWKGDHFNVTVGESGGPVFFEVGSGRRPALQQWPHVSGLYSRRDSLFLVCTVCDSLQLRWKHSSHDLTQVQTHFLHFVSQFFTSFILFWILHWWYSTGDIHWLKFENYSSSSIFAILPQWWYSVLKFENYSSS